MANVHCYITQLLLFSMDKFSSRSLTLLFAVSESLIYLRVKILLQSEALTLLGLRNHHSPSADALILFIAHEFKRQLDALGMNGTKKPHMPP